MPVALVKVTPARAETPVTPSVDWSRVAPVTVREELAFIAPVVFRVAVCRLPVPVALENVTSVSVEEPVVWKVPTICRVELGSVVPIPILVELA